MKAVSFKKIEVVNPTSGVVSTKVNVVFDNGVDMNLLGRDMTTDELIAHIKLDRQAALDQVVVRNGQYGQFAVLSQAKTLEEF